MYRNKKGHIINTASDVMAWLLENFHDLSPENLPPTDPGRVPRTEEAQALVDYVHSDEFQNADEHNPLVKKLEEANYTLAMVHCQLAAGVLYEYQVEPREGGVDRPA